MDKNIELLIDISKPKQAFQNSLELSGNSRLIFSAPFGSGKTFFLKKYFLESEIYISIHLYPTNYSVSKNEDIFDLMKYDILYELLNHKLTLDKVDVSFTEALPFLNSEEQIRAISLFLSFVPKIGKNAVDIFEGLNKIFKTIEKKRKELQTDQGKVIKDFATKIEQTTGSIYEIDLYSNLIIDLIGKLKNENKKEIVLIIDDLDRIDPDHIFRLLNIFASHMDLHKNEENKFGFDKIILSCDIENIRTIFHNKFGQDVDFSGYIDKFYSREIFEFDNKILVSQSVDKILSSIKIEKKFGEINFISNPQKIGFFYLKLLLISFINSNAINLRVLLKLYDKEYQIKNYSFSIGRNNIQNWRAAVPLIFDFLVDLFGDVRALKRAIDKTQFSLKINEEFGIRDIHALHLAGELMLLADMNTHNFIPSQLDKPPYILNLDGKKYIYKIETYDHMHDRLTAYFVNEAGMRLNIFENIDLKSIIKKAYESYLLLEKAFER